MIECRCELVIHLLRANFASSNICCVRITLSFASSGLSAPPIQSSTYSFSKIASVILGNSVSYCLRCFNKTDLKMKGLDVIPNGNRFQMFDCVNFVNASWNSALVLTVGTSSVISINE